MKITFVLSTALLLALAKGQSCTNAVVKGLVGRSCSDNVVTVVDTRRLDDIILPHYKKQNFKCDIKGECNNNAVYVTLGNGCFWERQYAYTNVEMKIMGRQRTGVSARVGYTGSKKVGPHGEVCYHSDSTVDYHTLGHTETVQVKLDSQHQTQQFKALVTDFFASFTYDPSRMGMRRPDDFSQFSGDHGSAYRSAITIPGGIKGSLYHIVVDANKKLTHPMTLVEGKGGDADVFNTVYIMDSDEYLFYVGEEYHQFHANFFGARYESEYLGMNSLFRKDTLMAKSPGCTDYRRRSLRSGTVDNMLSF